MLLRAGIKAASGKMFCQDFSKRLFSFRQRPLSATLREVWREGGLRVLFRGTGVVLLRAFPANSATFIGYEYTIKALVMLS